MNARIEAVPARFRRNRFCTAVVALIGATAPVASSLAVQKPGDPVGGEVYTSFSTFAGQYTPQVAVDADGDAVVVFDAKNDDTDGDGVGVKMLKIDSHGRFVAPGGKIDSTGEPRLVNTTTTGSQRSGAIAMDRDGDFVVTWMGGPFDSGTYDIYFQRYDKTFQAVGSEVKVTSRTSGQTFADPAVAMDADGDFVITWIDNLAAFGVRAQRFLADGSAKDVPFNVSNQTGYPRSQPRIAMDAQGDFAVAWTSRYQDGDGDGVFMRAFDASGAARANEIVVNTGSGNSQSAPDIAMDQGGEFVVVWNDVNGQYFSSVYFQRFDASGAAVGSNSFVSDESNGDEHRPSVSMADNGDFVVAWNGYSSDPPPLGSEGFSAGVLARRFAKDGTPLDATFRVNQTTAGSQKWVDVALDADGDIATAYSSFTYYGYAAAAARYAALAAIPSGTAMLFQRFTGSEAVDVLVRQAVPTTTEVVVDTPYKLDLTIRNRHVTGGPEGVGTATGVAVDLISSQGSFLGVMQSGWECGPSSICLAAGFCLTCITDTPIPAGGNLKLTVKLQAPPDAGTATTSVGLNLNQYDAVGRNNRLDVQRTVVPVDDVPDDFAPQNQTGVPLSTVRTSAPFTVSGINVRTAVTADGGSFSKNGGAFRTSGTVVAGDVLVARHRSADTLLTATVTRLDINGVTASFQTVTEAPDTTPSRFTFESQTGVPVGSLRVSNAITVQGINTATPISVDKGEYRINGGAFTSASGTVAAGDTVIVRQTASSSPSTTKRTTLTIGDRSGNFSTTTAAPDTHPNPFTFVSQTGVPINSLRTSNAIVVGGINTSVAIGITGGAYSVNNLPYTTASGQVKSGDFVRVRHTSGSTPATAVTTTLTIGDVSGTFQSTTAP